MTPTPAQFRDIVLCTLGKHVGFQPNVEVGSTEVTEAVISGLPELPDDIRKARNNVNWAATQVLRGAGLVLPAGKRGFWGLTLEGVAEARRLAGVVEDPVGPVAATPSVPTVTAPVPDDSPTPPSPWADDPAGVVVYAHPAKDSYGDDGYIRSLGIEQTRCYGGYQEREAVCLSCPVARSCRSKQYAKFAAVAERLRQSDADAVARGVAPSAPAYVETTMDDNLDDVLDSLESAPVAPPVDAGIETTAGVDSVCYKCFGAIPENATCVYVAAKGHRHVVCPP